MDFVIIIVEGPAAGIAWFFALLIMVAFGAYGIGAGAQWIAGALFQSQLSSVFFMLTRFGVLALLVALTIFVVSMRSSAGVAKSLTEAAMGGLAYQLYYVTLSPYLPDALDEALMSLVHLEPLGVFLFLFAVLSPLVLDAVFLSLGSIGDPRLRESYRAMNNALFLLNAVPFSAFMVLNVVGNLTDPLNAGIMVFFVTVLMWIICSICSGIQNLFLRER